MEVTNFSYRFLENHFERYDCNIQCFRIYSEKLPWRIFFVENEIVVARFVTDVLIQTGVCLLQR